MRKSNPIVSFLRGSWRALDVFRRVVHLLVMLFFAFLGIALLSPAPPIVPSTAALVIAPKGALVDQLDGDALTRAWDELTGSAVPQTLVKELIDAIDAAGPDKRIAALVLDLEQLGGGGVSKLQDLATAVRGFADTGKPVIAVGDYFTQGQYYLAAHADEVYMHPQGFVFFDGFGHFPTYYKGAIDKLSIDWNVFKVGEYKSFVEPFLRDDMSPEARRNAREWLDALWAAYQKEVTAIRELEPNAVGEYAERFAERLGQHGGDLAELALASGLVDALWDRDQMSERLIEIVGSKKDERAFRQIGHSVYLRAVNGAREENGAGVVGVVVASGDILNGTHPPGTVGGDSTAALVREARFDDDVKALVLRVDSPGGSAFASDVILRELELLQEAGKPLVVSMGSVAASGGYWISMSADEIWASASSITGSIGIGGYFPTFQRTLDRIGVHVDGVGTTRWAGALRPDRELSEEAKAVFQLNIERGYDRFITKVADARDMSRESVDEIARGRVWIGADAQRVGLVDQLGDLDDAVGAAARLAELGDDYHIRYIEKEMSFQEAVALQFARVAQRVGVELPRPQLPGPLLDMRRELERLARFNDPLGVYYHCFCRVD